ncbi:hypothetical protein ADU59_25815 [Pararhizobium polonicum]|uniref:DUF3329 domain-containing protein n=1 Tax=Pararhizobium polonicum TaxID=1612624 RepID=A0A1C7NU30_9HYPH|nr:hypothetical protein [Pararhizobium polonicum]OBZ92483.1 hypothetical protein ADU59_25815 [Pararhizobium polonicum]
MMKFIDPDHPFYRPLWVRLLIVVLCTLWTAVEFWNGASTWGMIFLAVSAYTACVLLIFFKPKVEVAEEAPKIETAEPAKTDDPA